MVADDKKTIVDEQEDVSTDNNYGNANHSWITSEQQVKLSLSKSHTEK